MNRRQLATGLVAAAVLLGAGCGHKPAPAGGAHGPKAEAAKRAAIDAALGGAAAGAEAQARMTPRPPFPPPPLLPPEAVVTVVPPQPPEPPQRPGRPTAEVVIHERVSSATPHPSEADADADALAQVRKRVAERLEQLSPAVRAVPSADYILRHYVPRGGRAVRRLDDRAREHLAGTGANPNAVYVEYEVVLTADQVRELRGQDRLTLGLRLVILVVGVSVAGFLFLRLDDWTKGYLTSWLAVAAATLAGCAAAAAFII